MKIWWTEGDVVRKLRAVTGWRLEDLATRSGVGVQVIHRIESGATKEPTKKTMTKIAEAFGLTYRDFLDLIPPVSRDLLPDHFAAGGQKEVTPPQPHAAAKERGPQKGRTGRSG